MPHDWRVCPIRSSNVTACDSCPRCRPRCKPATRLQAPSSPIPKRDRSLPPSVKRCRRRKRR
ncbi:MAG: hypothetical protein MZV64_00320 [Ignavibacteriales bacterium]|nr:hypothetical protein [Ignavibacteriales bacterium]